MPIPFPTELFADNPAPPFGDMCLWFDFSDHRTFWLQGKSYPGIDSPATATATDEVYRIVDKSQNQYVAYAGPSAKGWRYIRPKDGLNKKSVIRTLGQSVMTGLWKNYDELTLFIVYYIGGNGILPTSRMPIFGQMTFTVGETTYNPIIWYGQTNNIYTQGPGGNIISNQGLLPNRWIRLTHIKSTNNLVTNWVGNYASAEQLLTVDPLSNDYRVNYTIGGNFLAGTIFGTPINMISGYYAEIIAYPKVFQTQNEINSINSYLVQKWADGNVSFGSTGT